MEVWSTKQCQSIEPLFGTGDKVNTWPLSFELTLQPVLPAVQNVAWILPVAASTFTWLTYLPVMSVYLAAPSALFEVVFDGRFVKLPCSLYHSTTSGLSPPASESASE